MSTLLIPQGEFPSFVRVTCGCGWKGPVRYLLTTDGPKLAEADDTAHGMDCTGGAA